MRSALSRPRPRAAGVVVMLALHAGLLIGIWALGRWPARRAPQAQAQAPLVVRLLEPRSPTGQMSDRLQPHRPASPARASRPGGPQAITLTAAPADRTVITPTDAVAAVHAPPAVASAPASAPLDLKLRSGAGADWRTPAQAALDDPRANTLRPTLESRISAVLGGSDAVVEERLADGSVRFRRGQSCVIARPNRAQAIDPFNGSVLPKPRLIESC